MMMMTVDLPLRNVLPQTLNGVFMISLLQSSPNLHNCPQFFSPFFFVFFAIIVMTLTIKVVIIIIAIMMMIMIIIIMIKMIIEITVVNN